MAVDKILVIEDDVSLRSFLSEDVLPYHGYEVVSADTGTEGLKKLASEKPDLLLLDLELPDMSGMDVLNAMRQDASDVPVILMTAYGSESIAIDAFRLGARDYLIKPFAAEEAREAVEHTLSETRLRKEKESLTRSLEQRVQQLEVLSGVGKSVVSLMDLQTLLNRIVESGVYVTKAEEGFLLLVDPETNDLYLRAGKNLGDSKAQGLVLKVEDSLAGQVLKKGKPVLRGGEGTGRDYKVKTGYLVKSLLHVPLTLGDRVIGVLSVDNQVSDREFTEDDQYVLSALADYAAVSIQNATLYDQLKRTLDDLKASQHQLIQSSKLAALGRLTASLAHEINNPLQAIWGSISLLAEGPLDEEKRAEYLSTANKELERLVQLVGRMLDFYRPSREKRSPTSVNELLEDTLTLASKQLQDSDIATSLELSPDLPPVEAVPAHLKQVFLNLTLNAVEAMPRGGKLSLKTFLDEEKGEVAIVFRDTGVGISPENLQYVFEPFYTTREDGTGLGLFVSHTIVEQHAGRIEVSSDQEKGSTFTVRLPAGGEPNA